MQGGVGKAQFIYLKKKKNKSCGFMDVHLMTFVNVCILVFGLFASFVDSQEQWQSPPVLPPPPPPPPPPTLRWEASPPPPPFPPPPPPPPLSTPIERRRHPPPPPIPPSPSPQVDEPPLVSPVPSISPSNGRPFVTSPVPSPGQGEQPPRQPPPGDPNTRLAKIIGWMFLGVAIIMQVLVGIFLVIKRRQLFNPDNAY